MQHFLQYKTFQSSLTKHKTVLNWNLFNSLKGNDVQMFACKCTWSHASICSFANLLPLPAKCMSLVCYYVSLVCVSAVGCVFDLSEPVCVSGRSCWTQVRACWDALDHTNLLRLWRTSRIIDALRSLQGLMYCSLTCLLPAYNLMNIHAVQFIHTETELK